MDDVEKVIDGLYRTESQKLLAVLTRLFGAHNLALAEDVTQESFQKALTQWRAEGLPPNPGAWLTTVAKHSAIDRIRKYGTRQKLSKEVEDLVSNHWTQSYKVDKKFSEPAIAEDQLRMIFMCCQPSIKPENRLPLILKTLCGLTIPAIARALLLTEETVKKRLHRTRAALKEESLCLPSPDGLTQALDTVHAALYLLFNEGYYSSKKERVFQLSLCEDAIGLTRLLVETTNYCNRDTIGMFALMHFLISRIHSRQDSLGNVIPLDKQDRGLWTAPYIEAGCQLLETSKKFPKGANGRYVLEARIAKEHCLAATFEDTNWLTIGTCYQELVALTNSPMAKLNHAIAQGYAGDPTRGLNTIDETKTFDNKRFEHLRMATKAHLYALCGDRENAERCLSKAKVLGGTARENQTIAKQIAEILRNH